MSLLNGFALAELLRDGPRPVLLDVRWSLAQGPGRQQYLAGHIDGAVFVDLDAQLCGTPGAGGRHPLPDPGRLQDVLRGTGMHDDSPVVVYDDGDMLAAARAWWTLRWAGVSDVRVLDGGWQAWLAGGGDISTRVPHSGGGTITVRPGSLPTLDAEQAAKLAREELLIDVRAAARFRGETEPIDPIAGHIPAAVNQPAEQTMNPHGPGLAAATRLHELFTPLRERRVGVYCGSGVTAARTALAMHAAGLAIPPVYIGSWSNWVADPDRPVATGE